MLPETLWFIIEHYPNHPGHGIGSRDACTTQDDAENWFSDAVSNGHPVAVLRVHVGAGGFYGARDVTDDFEHSLHERCIDRGLDCPEVKRLTPDVARAAA